MNITASATPSTQKNLTLLLYSFDGQAKFQASHVNDLERVGSDAFTNVVAQVDTGAQCNRFLLRKDADLETIDSPKIEALGAQNMADPEVLANFIKWGVETYPAEQYMVVLCGSPDGFVDHSHNASMRLPQIREGFEIAQAATGKKIDVIGLDAGMMATADAAYELQDQADILVASQTHTPPPCSAEGNTPNHARFLNAGFLAALHAAHENAVDIAPAALAASTCVQSGDASDRTDVPNVSAIKLAEIPNVATAVDDLANAMVETPNLREISRLITRAQQNNDSTDIDIMDFAGLIAQSAINDSALKAAANGAIRAVSAAVIAEHSPQKPHSNGLFLTGSPDGATQFSHDVNWFQALWDLSLAEG